jgi:hypothetical protein
MIEELDSYLQARSVLCLGHIYERGLRFKSDKVQDRKFVFPGCWWCYLRCSAIYSVTNYAVILELAYKHLVIGSLSHRFQIRPP